MGDTERIWYYIIVATAGHDTTSYALSGGMEAMVRDPSQLWALRDDPELAGNAADECIRWTSPVRHFMRYADRGLRPSAAPTFPKAGGYSFPTRAPIETRTSFRDPMSFDVRRAANAESLVSFGGGDALLPRSQFARREVRTMLAKAGRRPGVHRAQRAGTVVGVSLRIRREAPARHLFVPIGVTQSSVRRTTRRREGGI